MYHGWGKTKNYFEGWYFKFIDPTEQYAFAAIPGISKGKDGNQHAFIQLLDGKACTAAYHNFKSEEFRPSGEQFELNLGTNYFSAKALKLDLPELKGHLQLKNIYPWPKMLGAPGIMGWYSFVPFMQCYHGVVSMNHELEGTLNFQGKDIDFTGGKGYIEKDWGSSFPNAWIWMQTNHFDSEKRVSFMASVANIPWMGTHFIGCLVGLLIEDKLYRFATYTGAKYKAQQQGNQIHIEFKDKQNRLTIDAQKAEGGNLISPIEGDMTGKVNESLQAIISIKLYEKEKLVFEGDGRNAGLEVAGLLDRLLTKKWR